MKKICITGGAGFVGSNLAVLFKEHYVGCEVVAIDNLMRRGSELNLERLRASGVVFSHGDVRNRDDLEGVGDVDLLIDCSAEPSVHAGAKGSPRSVVDINLYGTVNCLEFARERGAAVLFLSTSRVYPIAAIKQMAYREEAERFVLEDKQNIPGASGCGIAEDFPLEGARSFYGASKLASELLLDEYIYNCGVKGLINRCGVLTGPWQMGKVDQGVITLWVARHYFAKPLQYIGFGGSGKQVRDILHVRDLFDLIMLQMKHIDKWDGRRFNVGGGKEISVSLRELTTLCRKITGRETPIKSNLETSAVDIPVYLSDTTRVRQAFGWQPQMSVQVILEDIARWLRDYEQQLKTVFC